VCEKSVRNVNGIEKMMEDKDVGEMIITIMECLTDEMLSNKNRAEILFSVLFNMINFFSLEIKEKFLFDLESLLKACRKDPDPENIVHLLGERWTMRNYNV
jgi:hypothetical protein